MFSGYLVSFLVERATKATVLLVLPELREQRPRAHFLPSLCLGTRRGLTARNRLLLRVRSLLGNFIVDRHVREIRAEAAKLLRAIGRGGKRHGGFFPA